MESEHKMKLIHVADIHLGAKMEAKLPKEKAKTRRLEMRATFARMLEYAEEHGVTAVLFAGDIFDSNTPNQDDKKYFYNKLRKYSGIDFYYLRGNHDSENSYTELDLTNLHLFGTEWTSYEKEGVVISGVELDGSNARSLYTTLALDKSKTNIVMLHGDIHTSGSGESLSLKSLMGKGIDYLALGHIHAHRFGKLDDRGTWCYAGCLEGRSYDECGDKGFVVLDTEEGLAPVFVPFAKRNVHEIFVDASCAEDAVAVEDLAEAALKGEQNNLVRLILKGEMRYDGENLAEHLKTRLGHMAFHLDVQDKRRRLIRPEEYAGDLSLRGEFVRLVEACDMDEDKKQRILEYGLKILKEGRLDV